MGFWAGFFIGLFIGANIGIVVAAFVASTKRDVGIFGLKFGRRYDDVL